MQHGFLSRKLTNEHRRRTQHKRHSPGAKSRRVRSDIREWNANIPLGPGVDIPMYVASLNTLRVIL